MSKVVDPVHNFPVVARLRNYLMSEDSLGSLGNLSRGWVELRTRMLLNMF